MNATGYGKKAVDPLKFVHGINQTFEDWELMKHKNIMGYRNYAHKSLVTQTMSPMPGHNKSWIQNKWQDDLAFYKNMHK